MREVALVLLDDDGERVDLDPSDAAELLALTEGLEAATVSACPTCKSRVLAAMALADLLEDAPHHSRRDDLLELLDDAPTLHLYVIDAAASCAHRGWRDPLHDEWLDAVDPAERLPRRP